MKLDIFIWFYWKTHCAINFYKIKFKTETHVVFKFMETNVSTVESFESKYEHICPSAVRILEISNRTYVLRAFLYV